MIVYVVPTIFVAVRIASRWSDDGLDRCFVALLLGTAQAVGVPLLLSMLHILDRNVVLVAHIVLAAAVFRFVPRATARGVRTRPSLPVLATTGIVAAFMTLSGLLALRSPSFDFDSRNYHLPQLADWIQGHSFWSSGIAQPASYLTAYPSNGEFLGVWFALPTHGDQLSLLAPVLFTLLGILAVAFLCRELGGQSWVGALAGTAVFATPLIFATQSRSLATDTIAASSLVAAAALMTRAFRRYQSHWIVAAGIALGLGMGSKYTAMVPGVAIFVTAVVLFRRSNQWVWLIPGLLIFFAPWLVRNAVHTGNPLFPQEIKVAGVRLLKGTNNPITAFSTPVIKHFVSGHWSVVGRWFGYVVRWLAVVPLLAAIGFVTGFRGRELPAAARAMSLVALAAFVGYLSTPYTGGGPTGNISWLLLNIRYVLPALLIGVALAAAFGARTVTLILLTAALAYDAARILGGTSLSRAAGLSVSLRFAAISAAASGVVVLVAARWRIVDLRPRSLLRQPVFVTALAIVVAWGGTAFVLYGVNKGYAPTPLEALVDRAHGSNRTVEEVGVREIRDLLGRRFDVHLLAPSIPYSNRSSKPLDAALRLTDARVLVVSSMPAFGIPSDYKPPREWCLYGRSGTEAVYLRAPACSAAVPQ